MFNHTTLSTILKFIPRAKFKALVDEHKSDYYKKSFKTWDHLVVMLIGQLTGARSLRDLETIINAQQNSFYHLNLGFRHLSRSTLSDANAKQNPQIFRQLACYLMANLNKKHKSELSTVLSLLDSSPIQVKGRGSSWTQATKTGHNIAGLKLHLQFNATAGQIEYVELTDANVNDISIAQSMPLQENRLYVFDKGYCDYNWWYRIMQSESQFVTRLKNNAAYEVIEALEILPQDRDFILKDQVIKLKNKNPRGGKKNDLAGINLRLVTIKHPSDSQKTLKLVSNAGDASAVEIAGWYKQRWGIELLFKWLKQNLKLKTFIGQNRNAICLQIYVAIITFILLQAYQRSQGHSRSRLKDIVMLVSIQLFVRPNLIEKVPRRHLKFIHQTPQIPLELNYVA